MRIYRALRFLLYLFFITTATYLLFLIFFPSEYFTFSFINPNSSKNNLINLKNNGDNFIFNTPTIGKYSNAKISFILNKKAKRSPLQSEVKVRKSYQAFLYPEGDPTGLKDGTLVKNAENFFIVSNKQLRKFQLDTLDALGFNQEDFIKADEIDLFYNTKGQDISSAQTYPDFTIFKSDSAYYLLKDGELKQFISEKAYLSHYNPSQAISKDEEFISLYKIKEEPIGFSDGSLIAYGESAYVVSGKKILPINNPVTFESSGYLWDDLIAVSGDEISLYEKGGLFRISSPHPDGTILADINDSKWYIIKENKKSPLPSSLIADSWIQKTPITVSLEGANLTNQCQLKKGLWSLENYACDVTVLDMQSIVGKDYEFKTSFGEKLDIRAINVRFNQDITFSNFKSSLYNIAQRVKTNYASQI